jgi:homoserine dehydrogenase
VVADIVDAARRIHEGSAPVDLSWMGGEDAVLRPLNLAEGRYYLRFEVADRPGVLGRVATILGEHGVSVASMVQREGKGSAAMVIDTHVALERSIQTALEGIRALEGILAVVLLRHYDRGFEG